MDEDACSLINEKNILIIKILNKKQLRHVNALVLIKNVYNKTMLSKSKVMNLFVAHYMETLGYFLFLTLSIFLFLAEHRD